MPSLSFPPPFQKTEIAKVRAQKILAVFLKKTLRTVLKMAGLEVCYFQWQFWHYDQTELILLVFFLYSTFNYFLNS